MRLGGGGGREEREVVVAAHEGEGEGARQRTGHGLARAAEPRPWAAEAQAGAWPGRPERAPGERATGAEQARSSGVAAREASGVRTAPTAK